jgi:hypothetical protein
MKCTFLTQGISLPTSKGTSVKYTIITRKKEEINFEVS